MACDCAHSLALITQRRDRSDSADGQKVKQFTAKKSNKSIGIQAVPGHAVTMGLCT
ncbi:hypothetical protein HaLaN_30077, partial [Haematococcus lacustris]